MYIDKITLNNFRVYKGTNELNLSVDGQKNVSLISGNNGYGKTSFLTSLVWCLYGKLIGDVDEKYRKEIYETGGYKKYCRKIMNRLSVEENQELIESYQNELAGADNLKKKELQQKMDALTSFSVTIRFKRIFIPAIPCDYLEVIRTYNTSNDTETITILIDGRENELTREVGPEIFINDFILRKEIAKFFFFDAEKIVALAEIRTIEERRSLSQAYGEVLGIKKYLDLKENFENLRIRLRKKTPVTVERNKLDALEKQQEQVQKMIQHIEQMVIEKEEELAIKKQASNKLQEQLIREGSSISLEELKEFREIKERLNAENQRLKAKQKDLFDLAPLAIATNYLLKIKEQIEAEQDQKNRKVNESFLKRKLTFIKKAVNNNEKLQRLSETSREEIIKVIGDSLFSDKENNTPILLNFSAEQEEAFWRIYDELQNSYNKEFKTINRDVKLQQTSYASINRKIADAESKDKDPVIKTIRADKLLLDDAILLLERECIDLRAEQKSKENESANIASQISTLRSKIQVEDKDKKKDEAAEKIVNQLEAFIHRFKFRKKAALEQKILKELKILMHKSDFVQRVEVIIEGDLIDIELYDSTKRKIDKDTLSKGEQQLYATALLKALVEESNIRFPVFIDSPLQKFDRSHAENIIKDFYPNVSGQVVLFPLLEKELNEEEYNLLNPKTANCYLIVHKGQYHSMFRSVQPENLFSTYRNQINHVHQH